MRHLFQPSTTPQMSPPIERPGTETRTETSSSRGSRGSWGGSKRTWSFCPWKRELAKWSTPTRIWCASRGRRLRTLLPGSAASRRSRRSNVCSSHPPCPRRKADTLEMYLPSSSPRKLVGVSTRDSPKGKELSRRGGLVRSGQLSCHPQILEEGPMHPLGKGVPAGAHALRRAARGGSEKEIPAWPLRGPEESARRDERGQDQGESPTAGKLGIGNWPTVYLIQLLFPYLRTWC